VSEKMEVCPKCDLEYAKKGESAVGRLLCLCDAKIDISGPFPILKEKQNQPEVWGLSGEIMKEIKPTMYKAVAIEDFEKIKEDLGKALQYLKEGKFKHSPNTTNSFVDELLYKYEVIPKPEPPLPDYGPEEFI